MARRKKTAARPQNFEDLDLESAASPARNIIRPRCFCHEEPWMKRQIRRYCEKRTTDYNYRVTLPQFHRTMTAAIEEQGEGKRLTFNQLRSHVTECEAELWLKKLRI